jgi:hypothetical protein
MADSRGPYRTFLRERIAPALRQLGLRGSGNNFVLPDDRTWALVGFQADWRLARDGIVSFTINLTAADKAAWDRQREQQLWYPAKPPATGAMGMHPAKTIRIGNLIPVDATLHDRWWTIDDGREHPYLDLLVDGPVGPPEQMADEVIAAVRDHGIPWLRSRADRDTLSRR